MDRHQSTIESELDNKKSLIERGRKKWAAASVIAALGVGALAGCSTSANAESPSPSVSSTEAPAPSASPVETEPVVAPIEVEPLSAELPADKLAEETMKIFDAWMIAGATDADIKATVADDMDRNLGIDYYMVRAQENGEVYAEALLGPGWQDDPQRAYYHEQYVIENANNIENALKKEWQLEEDLQLGIENAEREPLFSIDTTITDANEEKQEEEGTRTISFRYIRDFENDADDGREEQRSFVAIKYKIVDDKAYLMSQNHSEY